MNPVTEYAQKVVDGDIVAGKLVIAACQRHLNDLARTDFKWHFDEERAQRWIKFFPTFIKHYKGACAGKPFHLDLWQKFIFGSIFGWVDDKGMRRFRIAMVAVAKKNGKSAMSGGLALGLELIDNEPAAEIYTAATTEAQAKIVWNDCCNFTKRSNSLKSRLRIRKVPAEIVDDRTGGWIKPLSKNPPDGLNIHGGIIDEYHEHPDDLVFDLVAQGTVGRSQPLIFIITTAGYNHIGPCKQEWDYAEAVVNGIVENDRYFGYIATLDQDDAHDDESVWIKANPSLGSAKPIDGVRDQLLRAQQQGNLNKFKVKQLNQWVSGSVQWIDLEKWKQLEVLPDIESLRGEACYGGLDLASSDDFVALTLLFPPGVYPEWTFFTRFWVPSCSIDPDYTMQLETRRKRARELVGAIKRWNDQGHLSTTDGELIDEMVVLNDILELFADYDIQELTFDPYQARNVATRLMAEGVPVKEMTQNASHYNEPCLWLERQINLRKLRRFDNPCFDWQVGNVVISVNNQGYQKPDKRKSREKIDGPVSLLMAIKSAIVNLVADPPDLTVGEFEL